MSIGTGPAVAPETAPGEPRRPNGKWTIALVTLIGSYLLLAVYSLVANAGAIQAGTSVRAAAPASSAVKVGSSASATPSVPASRTATRTTAGPLEVTSVAAFGPEGTADGDNPGIASRVLDVSTDQPWYSQWYATPEFGNLRPGTGLLLDLAQTATVTGVRLTLGGEPGAGVEVRVGNGTSTEMPTVATATGIAGTAQLTATTPAKGRYVLIWFTKLPFSSPGKYQVDVYSVTVDGTVP